MMTAENLVEESELLARLADDHLESDDALVSHAPVMDLAGELLRLDVKCGGERTPDAPARVRRRLWWLLHALRHDAGGNFGDGPDAARLAGQIGAAMAALGLDANGSLLN